MSVSMTMNGAVIPILAFVLYLGANAIMKGMSAKNTNKENKNLESEGFYRDDLMIGDWKFYYANGNIMADGSFLNGITKKIGEGVDLFITDFSAKKLYRYNIF